MSHEPQSKYAIVTYYRRMIQATFTEDGVESYRCGPITANPLETIVNGAYRMKRQGRRVLRFTTDTLARVPQKADDPTVSNTRQLLAAERTFTKTDERVNDILLGPLERPALQWCCRHMPAWASPDLLTALGVVGGVIIAVGYWLSNIDTNFLWLVDFGYVVNWLGDSLDGNLARYRKIERFKYGYFLDHTVDTFTQTMVCVGLGLSPFVGFNYAMLALVSYLQLGILTYVRTAVTGVFKVSYGKIGPTEVRVIVIGVNAVFYFSSNPLLHLPFIDISLFNLIILSLAVAFFVHYIVATFQQAAVLNKQDRAQSHSSRAQ